MQDHAPAAVVTGASTGIGRAVSKSLAAAGWRVFGSVRKEKDAQDAAADVGPLFTPLIFDVTDDAAIKVAAQTVQSALGGRTLKGLVNNAGIAVAGPVRYLDLDDLRRQLDVNLYGVIRTTQAFLPMLGADRAFRGEPGKIVNMSSVAGEIGAPFMSPYAISKHALEALSKSLRVELLKHGVDVVVVGPGAIKTPIWAKADELDVDRYQGTEYHDDLKRLSAAMQKFGGEGLEPDAVGDLVRDILTGKKRGARYAILRNKFLMWTLPRLIGPRALAKGTAKRFGLASERA
jgi:hypothetical protein